MEKFKYYSIFPFVRVMDLETLFVESKWGILRLLSESGYSPLELAERLNTSISNISQQLRLLEMAGLVQKVKIQNRDKGKPRMIFSIAGDFLYTVAVTRSSAQKKLLSLNSRQQMMVQIWHLEEDLQYYLEKFFWKLEDKLSHIQAMVLDQSSKSLKVLVVVPSAGEERKGTIKIGGQNQSKEIEYQLFTSEEFTKKFSSASNLYVLYDPNDILFNLKHKGVVRNGARRS